MNDLYKLWNEFQNLKFPTGLGDEVDVADLADIDGTIAGCVSTFISSGEKLDSEQSKILQTCVSELEKITNNLNEEGKTYFSNLQTLGNLVLKQVSNAS